MKIMEEQEDLLSNELEITETLKSYFIDSAKWARFLSVVGLFACMVMLIVAFYAAFYVPRVANYRYGFSLGRLVSAVYVFFAVAWFFPCFFLYKFSVKLLNAIKTNVQENIESAFNNLKSTFKFLGIVTIVILSLWFMSFLVLVAQKFH
jgi:hypothetical protein